jgi:hypothetical protein
MFYPVARAVSSSPVLCAVMLAVASGVCTTVSFAQEVALPGTGVPAAPASDAPIGDVTLRIATFNIEDVRTADVINGDNPRLKRIAGVIGAIRPSIILLNEITYDMPGAPDVPKEGGAGRNGARLVENYLLTIPGLPRYRVVMPPVNTGVASGFDLDNDGNITLSYPTPPATKPDGEPGEQTKEGRAYGNDCWGFGTFPGQYGMALLVDERLTIDAAGIRTFARFPWEYMPGANLPNKPDGTPWYTKEELTFFRLSSKTHAVVPVKLPNGTELNIVMSHPTPPGFDGPEKRNVMRNHDEIRLVGGIVADEPWIVDDQGRIGGLPRFSSFVVMGDLNADPRDGNSYKDPMKLHLSRHTNFEYVPTSEVAIPGLDPWDTARFKLRVDYVLPSRDLTIVKGGVWRTTDDNLPFPSDHFPVWVDVVVRGRE